MLATHRFVTCFPEGWPTLAAKTSLAHNNVFQRSNHTAHLDQFFLADNVMTVSVRFVPVDHVDDGVASVLLLTSDLNVP